VSFSARAVEHVRARKTSVQSWYLDVSLLAGYFGGGERVYHHTAPISAILGLAEGLQLVEEEGMEVRAARHRTAAEQLIEGVGGLGFTPLVAAPYRLPMLTTLRLPETVLQRGEAALRRTLLERYGVEVSGAFGKLAGQVWRVGLMGENARLINVEALLFALRKELA
jgi:alanine-glyoxylate transaminase/serine-glyoxylate transaminase/serine-pyruvate transaminase